jgi:two-component system sensor histidine kinase KdpD
MFFRQIGMFESNIIMVYLLGILIFSYLAGGYVYSFVASICGVLLYNYFFTEPYYTLQAYRPDYPVTFFVMFITGFITSTLTIRVKRETLIAEEREERIKAVYQIEKRLLEVESVDNLAMVFAEEIAERFAANVLVQFFDNSGK